MRKAAYLGVLFLLAVSLGSLYVGLGAQLTLSVISLTANHQQMTFPIGMLMAQVLCSGGFEHHHHSSDPPAVGGTTR